MFTGQGERVHVLEEDPDLAGRLDPAAAADAVGHVVAPLARIERGPWGAEAAYPNGSDWIGLLVLSGFIVRRITCVHEVSAELIGPGDVLRPWDHDGDYALESIETSFEVLEPVRLALLDDSFVTRAAGWPQIVPAVLERIGRRSRWLSIRLTIAQLERATVRVLYLLWHLAERWGRATPEGLVVPLELTHRLIAELVGARRPSVTNAVAALERDGHLTRSPGVGWIVPHDVADRLDALMAP